MCNRHAAKGDLEACNAILWTCTVDGGSIEVLALYPFG
jgi:hypothetical protein